jgi:hypothetical protein
MLETLLGYTLSSDLVNENLYNELGKSQLDCFCPTVDIQNLDDPDPVVTAYRLYPYNPNDKFLHVDPFTRLNKVKLVYVKPGDGANGVTIRTFEDDEIRVSVGRDGIAKYIERCERCYCECQCQDCVQLAVDADWLWPDGDWPTDLQYLLADMVTYYADPKRDIRSESITTHSYTLNARTAPERDPANAAVLRKYAGPYGSAVVLPV